MILVTGGTGFIGTHLLEALSAAGEPVRALVRRARAPRVLPAGVEAVYGDLAAPSGIDEALAGVDTVIHLAGVTKALRTSDYYSGNVTATENLARAIGTRPIRLVHASSLAAMGPSTAGHPLSEEATPHPVSHYGKSKLEAERAVRRLVPSAVIVRPPVVYGPRDTDVFQLLQSVAKGLVVEISGGDRWFSAIYVRDLVDGILAAARAPQAAGRDYFLTQTEPATWRQFGASAARIMARSPRTLAIPFPLAWVAGAAAELWARLRSTPGIVSRDKVNEARYQAWTCDSARATRELGFTAPTSLESGLALTLAWYKEAGWLTY